MVWSENCQLNTKEACRTLVRVNNKMDDSKQGRNNSKRQKNINLKKVTITEKGKDIISWEMQYCTGRARPESGTNWNL